MMYEPPKRRKLSKAERETVYKKCNGHCAYCGKEISITQMQVDHLIPHEMHDTYKLIGKDLDEIDNLMPSCRGCNNYKSTLTLEKFRTAIERWPSVLESGNVTYRNAVRFGMVEPRPHSVIFYFERNGEDEND